MGVRMGGPWPVTFFGFQAAPGFSIDARLLMLLGVAEHFADLVVDGGHPGSGTVNWEMYQWQGLLDATKAFPEIAGAAAAAQASVHYMKAVLFKGVYPDGIETEQTTSYGMAVTANFYGFLKSLPDPDPALKARVEAMFNYAVLVADPQGCLPRNGDSSLCTSGYSAGAARYFSRPDWDYAHSNGATGERPPGYVTFRLDFYHLDHFELDLRGHLHVRGAAFSCLRLKLADTVLI